MTQRWNNPCSRSKAITEKVSTTERRIILWRLQSIERLHGCLCCPRNCTCHLWWMFNYHKISLGWLFASPLGLPRRWEAHWGRGKALPPPWLNTLTKTIGPVQHSCSLLLIFIYYLQLLISSESALEILCKPPHVSLRGTGKHSLLHRWQNEVNPGCAQQEPVKRATPQPQVSAGPHRESGPPFPSQLSPPGNPTLPHTWHFWLLFAEFVSWGSHRLHRHHHLQRSLASSSSHAGFCGAF